MSAYTTRRTFLKGLLATSALAAVPLPRGLDLFEGYLGEFQGPVFIGVDVARNGDCTVLMLRRANEVLWCEHIEPDQNGNYTFVLPPEYAEALRAF